MSFLLPTNKQHISFSELKEWIECPYRHKLKYVDQIDKSLPSPVLDFGTSIHAVCEAYLKTRIIDISIFENSINELWEKNHSLNKPLYDKESKINLIDSAKKILYEIPAWFETQFPNWKTYDAEELLYETINNETEAKFKGFIDCIIEVPTIIRKKEKKIIWILDWKTSASGWRQEKRRDFITQSQIILYKHFWSEKHKFNFDDIKCGFILLKKNAKANNKCELIKVSVGEKTKNKSLKLLSNAVSGIQKGLCVKNRTSCKYCPYFNTEHCK